MDFFEQTWHSTDIRKSIPTNSDVNNLLVTTGGFTNPMSRVERAK